MTHSLTLTLAKPGQPDTTTARRCIAIYRADGQGSNRTNWEQVTSVLACVLAVVRTGLSVEITALYAGQAGTKSPAYNLAHRQLSQGAIRPMWENVQIVALQNVTNGKGTVTGTPNSTAPVGPNIRLFLAPTK
jgi:hypothetical protein